MLKHMPEHDFYEKCIFSENDGGVSIRLPWSTNSRMENASETRFTNADNRFLLVTEHVADIRSPQTTIRSMGIRAFSTT